MKRHLILTYASGIVLAIVATCALFSVTGCGLLLPDYELQEAQRQDEIRAKDAAIALTEKDRQDNKAQILAVQQAQVVAQQKLDVAVANLARVQATPNVPPEVTAGFSDLVASLQQQTGANAAELEQRAAMQAELKAQRDALVAQREAAESELRAFKVRSAAEAASAGQGLVNSQTLPGYGGIAAAILALLSARYGKSRATPAIEQNQRETDQQWEELASLRAQLAEARGRLALPTAPPVTHPVV